MDQALMAEDAGPRREISFVRLGFLLIVLCAIAGGAYLAAVNAFASSPRLSPPWFAPYVDASLTPFYQFQDSSDNLSPNVILGFVTASSSGDGAACSPAWGGEYSLAQAAISMNIDRRIVQFRQEGGNATISFGGEGGADLSVACQSVSALESAYLEVIERYGLRTIDLDDEQAAAFQPTAMDRRVAAIAALEKVFAAHDDALKVWLSLPAGPNGFGAPELTEVRVMLRDHVQIAGVNSLDIDFGDNKHPVTQMLPAVETSLRDVHGQLTTLYAGGHIALNSQQVWARMGSTVQIGENAVKDESFGLFDAQLLVGFADGVGLGRVSMWSLNRDSQCGSTFAVVGEHSNFCSGVAQGDLQFSSIFGKVRGTPPTFGVNAAAPTSSPAHFPFPVWQPGEAYPGGYLVVWEGEVYIAKYYTEGTAPDTPVQFAYQSPWELLGPVLSSDSAPTTTTLPVGTYPAWSAAVPYSQGARVLYHGLPFIAKFYNLGSSPGAVNIDPQYSPWQPLYSIPNEP